MKMREKIKKIVRRVKIAENTTHTKSDRNQNKRITQMLEDWCREHPQL